MPDIRLVIFDVDGTLAEKFTLDLLPGVKQFFDLLFNGECPDAPKAAIATNQGGVGMRYWMEKGGFGEPEKYPTREQVNERSEALMKKLGGDSRLPVYVSFRYMTKEGEWAPIPPEQEHNPRWEREWRKPLPGMLLEAMQEAGVEAEQTLFVGDREDDRVAAEAAGCTFRWAKDFFASPWKGCEEIAAIRALNQEPE
jgi:HAD superfamily hydrolase (TIGR01662 family)